MNLFLNFTFSIYAYKNMNLQMMNLISFTNTITNAMTRILRVTGSDAIPQSAGKKVEFLC